MGRRALVKRARRIVNATHRNLAEVNARVDAVKEALRSPFFPAAANVVMLKTQRQHAPAATVVDKANRVRDNLLAMLRDDWHLDVRDVNLKLSADERQVHIEAVVAHAAALDALERARAEEGSCRANGPGRSGAE